MHRSCADLRTVAHTAKAVNDQHIRSGQAQKLKAGLVIPWYIIDPTGELIKEQRSKRSTQLQLEAPSEIDHRPSIFFSKRRIAHWLIRCPTLYPAWDAVTATALIFTALVTPFEVGFMPPDRNPTSFLWITNRLVDLTFVLDLLFQFVTMRKMAVEKFAKAIDSKVEWETSISVIGREYIRSIWFYLDVLSIAPSVRRLQSTRTQRVASKPLGE